MPLPHESAARSYLFVPGDRPERFDKAWASQADEVIIDLEDAVAPDRKAAARAAIEGWIDPSRPVWVRLNASDTAWFDDDLALALKPGLKGFMVPKAEELPPAMAKLCTGQGLAILPIIGTAAGSRATRGDAGGGAAGLRCIGLSGRYEHYRPATASLQGWNSPKMTAPTMATSSISPPSSARPGKRQMCLSCPSRCAGSARCTASLPICSTRPCWPCSSTLEPACFDA